MGSVKDVVLQILAANGMTTIFGNPGSTELAFLDGLPENFRYILGLQEAAVVSMADGYAQATGRPALVNLHSAPGVGNAMGSIVNARVNRSPLVITAGTQVRPMQAMEAFLSNVRATELPQPAVKWAGEASRAEDTPAVLARAIHEATLPPPGPVFVSQPSDDWAADVVDAESRHVVHRTVSSSMVLDAAAAEQIAARLDAASAPVIILGAPLDTDDSWEQVVGLVEATGAAAMMAPLDSRWSFPGWHPNFRGVLLPGISPVAAQLAQYDLVLVLGAPVFRYYPYMPGELLAEGTSLIQITDDSSEAARAPMGQAFVSDPVAAVGVLRQAVAERDRQPQGAPDQPPVAPGATPLSPADVFSVLAANIPADTAMVNESPSNLSILLQHWRPTRAKSLFFSGSGGLGFGTAATVGVQLGMPDRPVLGVLGDGALHYSVQGLYTAALYNIPATFLVLRNQQYAILKWFGLLEQTPNVPGLDLPGLDAVAIAQGYGVPAVRVSEADELAEALAQSVGGPGPRLIEVDIDSSANVM